MNMKWQFQLDKKSQGFMLVLTVLISIIAGTVLANVIYHKDPAYLQPLIMDEYYKNVMRNYQSQSFPWRILPGRLGEILAFAMIYYWFHFEMIAYIVLGMISFAWGFLISIEIIRLGIQGLFYGGLCLLLHSMFYGLSVCRLILPTTTDGRTRKYIWILLLLLLALVSEFWIEPQGIVRFYH